MALTMTCPKCGGDLEYDTEAADSGDGPWAQSYWVGLVRWEEDAHPPVGEGSCRTDCGCWWTAEQIDQLDERATQLACEVSEP